MNPLAPIPGEDPAFLDAVEQVTRLAAIERSCLIVGERGTGKELFTTRLHYLSPRWDGPLIKLNCAAFTETLLDSELFGHEAGAFTGATRRHIGCFERAHGGTLVLDEIASASASVQEKLLRIIEYGELTRLGGTQTLQVDVRVVGSANVDLPDAARRGAFRADLLDRLAFDVVTLPPLRVRRDDILPLAYGFAIDMTRATGGKAFAGFSEDVEEALLSYEWPGNVRELKNVVERAIHHSGGAMGTIDEITLDPFDSAWRPRGHLGEASQTTSAPHEISSATSQPFTERVAQFEIGLLNEALASNRHNQKAAAESLSLGYHQFRRLVAKHRLNTTDRMTDKVPSNESSS